MNKRRLSLAAAAGVSLLMMSAAASAQGDVSGSLSILGFSQPDEIATTRVDVFREQYPNVELNITEGGLDEQQFLTSVAAGNPPDLVYIDRDVLSTYAVRGALQPLTQCIEQQGVNMADFREAAVNQVTINGEVYGVPEFFNTIVLIASGDALEEAGLTADDLNFGDWDNVTALNQALMTMDGGLPTRIGVDPKLPEFLPLWVAANGGSLLSEDGRTAQLNSPEVVEALEFATSLIDAQGGQQNFLAFRDTWDFFGGGNMIASSQLGVFPMEQWYVNVLADVSPDANAVFAPFTDREGNLLTFATGNAWAIPTGAANPDAACAFIATMTAADTWVAAAQARADLRAEQGATNTGVFTANAAADERIFADIVNVDPESTFGRGIQTVLSVQDAAFAVPANPAGAEFRQAWRDAVNRVLNGEQSVQEALDQAQTEAQAALDEAWSRSS